MCDPQSVTQPASPHPGDRGPRGVPTTSRPQPRRMGQGAGPDALLRAGSHPHPQFHVFLQDTFCLRTNPGAVPRRPPDLAAARVLPSSLAYRPPASTLAAVITHKRLRLQRRGQEPGAFPSVRDITAPCSDAPFVTGGRGTHSADERSLFRCRRQTGPLSLALCPCHFSTFLDVCFLLPPTGH